MNQASVSTPKPRFHVQVGLAECLVRGDDEVDAIRAARRQMIERMPELSQIIEGIQDREFRVDRLG